MGFFRGGLGRTVGGGRLFATCVLVVGGGSGVTERIGGLGG